MSYDLQIWTTSRPSWPECLPDYQQWHAMEGGLLLRRAKWQIVANSAARVLPEDIPDEIMAALPGIRFLVELNLEPIGAPSSARDLLRRAAASIARTGPGVIQDPQEDSITTPRGVKRYQRQPLPARISLLTFSWWFMDGPLQGETGYRELLSLLERYLPEALSRRYGEYEPPQFLYQDMGKEHFLELLRRARLPVVWYPHFPVVSVYLGVFADSGPTRQGFRANYLSIGVESSAYRQPGWQLGLERFWREMSHFIHPFYGDVRRLDGHLFRQGRLFIDQRSQQHPVMNGWWNGLPRCLGQATVLGEPYLGHWPAFAEQAEADDGLCFLSTGDWLSGESIESLLGGVPVGLAQGSYGDPLMGVARRSYPPIWPFEGPFKGE
jgi:hypothetical protein